MRRRRLGRSALEVPVVCFGAYALGGGYWGRQDDRESERAVARALDVGMDAFDTAPVYGFGRSEEVLGRALGARRERALVLTKVGLGWSTPHGEPVFEQIDEAGAPRKVWPDSRPDSVRAEVEASLRRLACEHLDMVQVHARDPLTPVGETMGALAALRAEGKLREIGVSNYSATDLEQARRALGDVPLASDQDQLNLLARGIEGEVVPWLARHEVGLLAYTPLAQGLLSGKVRGERAFAPDEGRAAGWMFTAANRALVNSRLDDVVGPIARAHDATIAQVVLAWTVAHAGVSAVLAGARSVAQVEENAAAADLALSPEELGAIGRAFEGLVLARPRPGLRARLGGILRRLGGR